MFGLFDDVINAGLNVAEGTFDALTGGDGPRREDVVKLIDAGLTIAMIAEGTGIAEDVLEALVADE